MFDARREIGSLAESYFVNLKATTYATDEIARSLGLIAELPCIVFLDAVPDEVKFLRLDERNLSIAVNVIRQTFGHFMNAHGYAQQRALLHRSHRLGSDIKRVREKLQKLTNREQDDLRKVRTPLPQKLLEAREKLQAGSVRMFAHELRLVNDLGTKPLEEHMLEGAVDRAKQHAKILSHLASTIRGISWYAEVTTAEITPDDLARINRIYHDHVSHLLNIDTSTIKPDKDFLGLTLLELRTSFRDIISVIWGDLPDPDALMETQKRKAASISELARVGRLNMQELLDRASAELASALPSLLVGARLTESFASIASTFDVDAPKPTKADQTFVEKALRSITAGSVTFVKGDVYIGNNVAAMGPSANATNTIFRSD